MKLFFHYLAIHLKAQMVYKMSFFLGFIAQFLMMFSYCIAFVVLFERFGNIQGFTVYEVFLAYSVVMIGYSLAEIFFRGFDLFSRQIVSGKFDQLLVRPRNLVLQVLGTEIAYIRFAKVFQGFLALGIAVWKLPLEWDLKRGLLLVQMLVSSFCTFAGIFVLGASYCFLTVQGLEVVNILVDGGREACQYPMGIYPKEFLRFFTFGIPFACFNYYPLLVLLGRAEKPLYALAPFWCPIFLLFSIFLWYQGAKKYQSTGS